MDTRSELVADISNYLQEQFPEARVGSSIDGLTANEVFTVSEAGVTRYVEVTNRWLEGDDAGVPLPRAIREWGVAREVKALPPNGTLRVATTGLERMAS